MKLQYIFAFISFGAFAFSSHQVFCSSAADIYKNRYGEQPQTDPRILQQWATPANEKTAQALKKLSQEIGAWGWRRVVGETEQQVIYKHGDDTFVYDRDKKTVSLMNCEKSPQFL
jgi:hypothetical protein